MALQNFTIQVSKRQTGKHNSRALRRDAKVPAVVYGPKTVPLSFNLTEQDAVRYSKHGFENAIFTLESSEKDLNGLKVLRKETTIHPATRRPIHMDFFALDMTQAVRVHVELRFEGKSLGVSEGGVFSAARRDVEIECLPTEIPEYFTVDITNLGLNQSLHVSDASIPSHFKLITSSHETIATCAVVEEVVATPAATDAAAPAAGTTPAAGSPAATTSDAKKADKK
ncbi:MAG: 50S ribosomal protein L25 [Bdellovibrionales bacterium]|nr:50S ribosomal protein L25 [Bdellovibrionales bacterium]